MSKIYKTWEWTCDHCDQDYFKDYKLTVGGGKIYLADVKKPFRFDGMNESLNFCNPVCNIEYLIERSMK